MHALIQTQPHVRFLHSSPDGIIFQMIPIPSLYLLIPYFPRPFLLHLQSNIQVLLHLLDARKKPSLCGPYLLDYQILEETIYSNYQNKSTQNLSELQKEGQSSLISKRRLKSGNLNGKITGFCSSDTLSLIYLLIWLTMLISDQTAVFYGKKVEKGRCLMHVHNLFIMKALLQVAEWIVS